MYCHKIFLRMCIVAAGVFTGVVYSDYCTQTYSCPGTCVSSVRGYTSCGFLWLFSCVQYRYRSYSCDKTCYRQVCCPGYTGSSCDSPLCDGSTSCPNGGTCRSPDYCSCPTGYSSPLCNDINECASSSHGCQHTCKNTPGSYYCTCNAGYVLNADRKTCIVNCGDPGSIANGTVSVWSTYFGDSATYTCDTHYVMSSGSEVRYCQNDFTWSGTEPVCTVAKDCRSSPCANGATCENVEGDLRCICAVGWDGNFCENDIQPPVMTGCIDDVHINATDHTVQYTWIEPTFTDPMGSHLHIVSNYDNPEFTFPWGDYTVQYVARKTSNGLVTECTFQVKVRPTPCEDLNVPANGARLCNGWKTDYGRFCMITCQQNYTLGPSDSFYTWYVCGASGSWIAASPVPDCEVQVKSNDEALYYHPEYSGYVFSPSCQNDVTQNTLRNQYIEYLKEMDGFSSFCSTYEDECTNENVEVQCSG